MKYKFSAFDALDNEVEEKERDIVSSFGIDHASYVLGVWVPVEGGGKNQVEPLYLTQAQLDKLKENKNASSKN